MGMKKITHVKIIGSRTRPLTNPRSIRKYLIEGEEEAMLDFVENELPGFCLLSDLDDSVVMTKDGKLINITAPIWKTNSRTK